MSILTEIKYTGNEYWKNYYEYVWGSELIDKWYEYATEDWIISNDRSLHLEVYKAKNFKGKTVVLSHGIAGYARVMLPFIIPLYEMGYSFHRINLFTGRQENFLSTSIYFYSSY